MGFFVLVGFFFLNVIHVILTCAAQEAAVTPPGPAPPKTVLEALEQRMAKYRETCDQAKAKGDERKARMYDRIVKVTDHMTNSSYGSFA